MTLYELTGEFLALVEMAESGEYDPQVIKDTLEGVEGELEQKADSYAVVINTLNNDVNKLSDEIKRLQARKKTIENNITSIKENLEYSMRKVGKTKFNTLLFGFNIQKNPPSLDIKDCTAIPSQFYIPQEPVLDKKAALDYVKEHGPQPWGELKQGESLRIR